MIPDMADETSTEPTFRPAALLQRLQLAMHNPHGRFAASNSAAGRQTMYEGTVQSHVIAKRRAKAKAAKRARQLHRKAAR